MREWNKWDAALVAVTNLFTTMTDPHRFVPNRFDDWSPNVDESRNKGEMLIILSIHVRSFVFY